MINNNKGFTLVELLLVVALTGLAVAITSDILLSVTRSYNRAQINNEVEQQASFINLKLNKELTNATDIISPDSSNESSNELIFKTLIGSELKEIKYYVDNGILYRQEEDSDVLAITSSKGLRGVQVNCGSSDNCFTLNSKKPFVLTYNFIFEKPDSNIDSAINVNNTIVIRGSY